MISHGKDIKVFTGNSNPALAKEICQIIGTKLGESEVKTFADGEGNLKEVLAAPDGIHFSAGNGYGAWVTYLRNHAKYSAANAWTQGSAYAAN